MPETLTNPLIELHSAGSNRDGKWLVRGIDLSIRQGEIVTLIGPNGSGKTTTAKLALGAIPTSQGTSKHHPDLKVGYVPQKVNVDWTIPLTCDRFMRLTSKLSHREVDDALEMTGIKHLRFDPVHQLSGGEFQRLLLARAIARKPNLLVLDEPVQGVDYNGQIALYKLIIKIRDELNCAVLLISHDLHVVMAETDRVLCINGHICCEGSPQSVIEMDAYKELFGENSAETLALYQHQHNHTHLPDGSVIRKHEKSEKEHLKEIDKNNVG